MVADRAQDRPRTDAVADAAHRTAPGGGVGRQPGQQGFEIKAGWTSASNDGGFLLLEVADVATLLDFSAKFKDLNDELDITPVVELGEGVGIAMGAYALVDSLA